MGARALVLLVLGLAACNGSTVVVGRPCTEWTGCEPDLTCDTVPAGGYCTQGCFTLGSRDECPHGAVCDAILTTVECLRVCDGAVTCDDGQDCVAAGEVKVCRPR